MSTLSAFPFIGEQSFATPGAFNSPLSIISANIAAVNAAAGSISGVTITPPSGNTITIASDLSVLGTIASGPHRIGVSSNVTNYLFLSDTSAARSAYVIGSQIGGTADGLNIWDDSGQTLIVSFSKQSVRFYQQVVGPVFDVGGALSDTLNAATFGSGSDSTESRIQAAVTAASLAGISRVYVPASMYPYSASSISFIHTVQMVREGGNWSEYDGLAYGLRAGPSTQAVVNSNVSALIAATAAAVAAGGGKVYIPSARTNYRVQSTFTVTAPVVWEGDAGGGSVLNWAFTNPRPGIVLLGSPPLGGATATQKYAWGLKNLKLQPATASNGTAIQFGSSISTLCIGAVCDGVDVVSWGDGLFFDNGGVLTLCANSRVLQCVRNVVLQGTANSGERLDFIGCAFAGETSYSSSIAITGNFLDAHFIGCTINSGQVTINTDVTSSVFLTDCHLENVDNTDDSCISLGGTGTLEIDHCLFSQNVTSPTMPGFIHQTGGTLVISGGLCNSNPTLTALINQRGGKAFFSPVPVRRNTTSLVTTSGTNSAGNIVSSYHVDFSNPAALSAGTVNDYAVVEAAKTYRLTPDASGTTVTGISVVGGNIPGRQMRWVNIGAGLLQLAHQHGSSNATNRILCATGSNIVLASNGVADLEYDAQTSRWRAWTETFFGDGTATAPSLPFGSEVSLGWYRSQASTMALSYGSLVLGTDPTGAQMLRVGGSVFIKAASSNPAVTIQAGAVQATAFGLGKNAGSELELALPAGGNQFMTGTISNDAVVHNAYTQNALFLGVGSGATSLSLDSLNVTLNSYGSLNLKQARLVSMRTAASLDSTTLAVNELAFMITGSAATMALRSAGTVWYFASSFSTKG